MSSHVLNCFSGLREYVRELKKRGEPAATDLPVLVGKLATRLVDILHLNAVLGYLGLSLEEEEATKKSAEEKTGGELATAKVVPIQQQSSAKRSIESGKWNAKKLSDLKEHLSCPN